MARRSLSLSVIFIGAQVPVRCVASTWSTKWVRSWLIADEEIRYSLYWIAPLPPGAAGAPRGAAGGGGATAAAARATAGTSTRRRRPSMRDLLGQPRRYLRIPPNAVTVTSRAAIRA